MIIYGLQEYLKDVKTLTKKIKESNNYKGVYGIPQGGIPLAISISSSLNIPLLSAPKKDCLVVDDLVDSGDTIKKFSNFDTATIHIKKHTPKRLLPTYYLKQVNDWVVYWWERNENRSIQDNVVRTIQFIGENTTRRGLQQTPERVVRSWKEIFSGYKQEADSFITVFDSDQYDQIILLKDIEMYSMCEHHMLPFFGKAHVAYIPKGKIIGISKLARLVDMYSRRLQIQERIGEQVTNTLMRKLEPQGAACIIEAQHLCMRMRGVGKQNSVMATSSLKGAFLDKLSAREELLRLIK